MRALFVSHTKRGLNPYRDHSTRYRCSNPVQDLRLMGHIADVCPLPDFGPEHADWYDAFVFHRHAYNKELENILSLLERLGKPCVADYDDLIFSPRQAAKSPLLLSGRSSLRMETLKFKRHLKALRLFKHVTVSTIALKREVLKVHPTAEVEVIHNGLSAAWVKNGQAAECPTPDVKVISYLPGSGSHTQDFREVQDILAVYLRKKPDVVLSIVGPLDFERKKFPAGRLITGPAVPYKELPLVIRSSWITIAPLQDTSFNRCKSGLKFFESAAFGVPVIASPIPDMMRFNGSGILFAKTRSEWRRALEFLTDDEKYNRVSRSVRDYALQECMSKRQTEKLFGILEDLTAKSRAVRLREGRRYNEGLYSDTMRESALVTFMDKLRRRMIKLCRDPRLFCLDSRFSILQHLGSLGEKK